MSIICIEDGFEHNIEAALRATMNGHESLEDFLEDVEGDEFATQLYNRAVEYMDFVETAKKMWAEKK